MLDPRTSHAVLPSLFPLRSSRQLHRCLYARLLSADVYRGAQFRADSSEPRAGYVCFRVLQERRSRPLRGALLARVAPAHELVLGGGSLPGPVGRRPASGDMGQSERKESGGPSGRLMSLAALMPTVPEIRYLLARLLLRPPIRARFIMAWSHWRRQHQAKAAAAHYRRQAKTQL